MNNKKGSHLNLRMVSFLILFNLISCSILSAMDNIPLIPLASSFAHEINLEHYELTKPSNLPLFYSWNFSIEKKFEYSYSKRNVYTNYTLYPGSKSEASATESELSGKLVIISNGDKTADILINNLTSVIDFGLIGDLEQNQKIVYDNIPDFIVKGVKEDGNTHQTGIDSEFMLGFLFPLPKATLKENGETKITRSLPVNLNGIEYNLTGETILTLAGFVRSDNNVFANMKATTDLLRQQGCNAVDKTFHCVMKIRSSYLFDIKQRIIFSGQATLLTGCRSTGKNSKSVAFDDDSLISIKIERIYENSQ